MDVYQHVLTTEAIVSGHRHLFFIENEANEELTDISSGVSKAFAILHVKFGYDKAVFLFNKALYRITDLYDFDICELDKELTLDTLFLVTVLTETGYEEVLIDELVKFIVLDSPSSEFYLKPALRFSTKNITS